MKWKIGCLEFFFLEIMEYPWNVLLGYKEPFETEIQWMCGGTLITERYILTGKNIVTMYTILHSVLALRKVA